MKTLQFDASTIQDQRFAIPEDIIDPFYPHLLRHPEAQLIWVVKGSGVLVITDILHPFKENDIFFLGANQQYVFKSMSPDGFSNESRTISIFFDPNGKLRSLFSLSEFDSLDHFICNNSRGFKVPEDHFKQISEKMLQFKDAEEIDKLMNFFYLLRSLADLSKETEPLCKENIKFNIEGEGGVNRINLICNYIKINYKNELTLEDVADYANLTPQAFCRYFKKHCGVTFIAYLNRIRVKEVCNQLNEDHLDSVSFIAYNCGFNSITNFNRVFKQIIGCNPKEYTNNYKQALFTAI